jgi:DNA-binding XRE family transcriptional regulator
VIIVSNAAMLLMKISTTVFVVSATCKGTQKKTSVLLNIKRCRRLQCVTTTHRYTMVKTNRTSQLLLQELAESGTTAEDLAEFMDVSVERVWQILNGEITPQVSERLKIADWFSLNPLVLWGTR